MPKRDFQERTGPPSLNLLNAHVLTMDPRNANAQAVAVRGGTISAVGSSSDIAALAGPGTQTIDCGGKTLMPGFVDSHCHVLAQAATLRGIDCSPKAVSSIQDLERAVKVRAETTQPDHWIRGFGYDDMSLLEERHPTRWDLDRAAPNHPVRLDHRSGHATVLNSRGLEMAGIDQTTPDPVDGVIHRDTSTGEPTGLLFEMAGFLRQQLGTSRDKSAFQDAVHRLNNTLLGYGITSVQDAGPDNGLDRWKTFQELQSSGALQCRVTMFAGASRLAEFHSAGLFWGAGDERLRLGHAKIMLTMTTGALEPDVEALGGMVDNAHRSGFPVAIHAVEQEAVEAAVRVLSNAGPLPTLSSTNSVQPVDRIEHCAECPPELVAEIAKSGCMVVTQPGFVYWNGDDYLERVDAPKLPNLYPVGALEKAGVPLAFGSDAPVIDPNPWPAIYNAVTRHTRSGRPLPVDAAQAQTITIAQALRMYTAAGAIAEGTGHRKGAIQSGMLADMVLLDTDPITAELDQIKEIRAVLTTVDGEVVWEGGS
jgi:predicted amidohydrolase YtcJ